MSHDNMTISHLGSMYVVCGICTQLEKKVDELPVVSVKHMRLFDLLRNHSLSAMLIINCSSADL